MKHQEAALKKLLERDLPLKLASPRLRHVVRKALVSGDSTRLLSAARLVVSDLLQQGILLKVAIEGQELPHLSYCLIKGTERLLDLSIIGNIPDADLKDPLTPSLQNLSGNPLPGRSNNASLTEFTGMLGAMEDAQDLEIGFPQSGETGVILNSILRLLAKFTPQFDLFILLFKDEILPEGQNRIFSATSNDLASGWLAIRQPSHSVWIPSPDELPAFIHNFARKNLTKDNFSSAVAVPVFEPGMDEQIPSEGPELGLLFLVAHEDWGRSPLLRLAKRLSRFVTRRWQHQREVNLRIHTDSLTKVYNRAFFDQQFTLELERARRTEQPLSLIICDLDHFKSVNDRFQHHNGDRVLKMVARRLRDELRRIDHVCRIGGEEFALILPDTPLSAAQEVMERLVNASFEEEIVHQGELIQLSVTFSFGAVTFPDAGSDAFELYRKADAMLFLSKDLGRNQCHFWNSEGDHVQLLPNPTET
ncbi:MAG: GGDEF domain-containing protein [bacterium]|nr:GGDEF domain-containing protein [bacterium]